MKKIVNESIINESSHGIEELSKVIINLRSNIFPKMADDEVYDFMLGLKGWVLEMLGEKSAFSQDTKLPNKPRGDMDPKSWGDKDDWRETGEMGG